MKGETTMTKFELKKLEMEVLERICAYCVRERDDELTHWGKLDTLVQKTEWNKETQRYEKVWEDEEQTIPVMTNDYGSIPYTEEELEEHPEILTKVQIYDEVIAMLEKRI